MRFLARLAELLNPSSLQGDAGFEVETREAGRQGLKFLGFLALSVPLATVFADLFALPATGLFHATFWRISLLLVLGSGMLVLSRWLPPPSLLSAILPVVVFLLSAVQVVANLWESLHVPAAYHYTPGLTAIVIFICAALLPLKPWQTLVSSLSVDVCVVGSERIVRRTGWLLIEDFDALHLVTMVTVSMIATVVSSALWIQREKLYRSAREAMASRSRALLAEHSAALGQISAAISHEINSPLGTLVSAAGTLATVGRRLSTSMESEHPRLLKLQEELRETIGSASGRIEEIVQRMQQFSNLEGPEVTDIDINALMRTALDMASAEDKVMFDPEVLAPVRGKPTELSFVLYTLARMAGEGENPRWIQTRMSAGTVSVRIKPLHVQPIEFELQFVAEGGRVAAGSASLFTARQIARRHGGELSGEPDLTLTLPAAGNAPRPGSARRAW